MQVQKIVKLQKVCLPFGEGNLSNDMDLLLFPGDAHRATQISCLSLDLDALVKELFLQCTRRSCVREDNPNC